MLIRHPHPDEAERICALFENEVQAGRMLPRVPDHIRTQRDDWLVIVQDDQVAGCVSLVQFNGSLCEIRSLAVDPTYQGQGLASRLVLAAVHLACQRDVPRVLALTRAVGLFTKLGFQTDTVKNYPEKVWADCAPCPFRHACDEVALIFHLHQEEHADDAPCETHALNRDALRA
ncbi:MAG: GNAT family N-acetyltransferase [Anaerolineae bacterium]|nr:GNAT family N-acetyltransferase [Anaerolineae bacterium]